MEIKAAKQTGTEEERKERQEKRERRWTAERKFEVVLTGLRGEKSPSEIAREYGTTQSTYFEWRRQFLAGGKEYLAFGGKSAQAAKTEKKIKEIKEDQRPAYP